MKRVRASHGAGWTLVLCLLLHLQCSNGGDGPIDPGPSPESLAIEGWQLFEAREFAAAVAKFEESLSKGNTYDGHLGLGWSELNSGELRSAVESLERARDMRLETADAFGGLAIALRDLEPVDFTATIASVDSALLRAPRYTFVHDSAMDWRDLRLIRAQSEYGLGQYTAALVDAESLGVSDIDPQSTNFAADLLAALEQLGNQIGSKKLR